VMFRVPFTCAECISKVPLRAPAPAI